MQANVSKISTIDLVNIINEVRAEFGVTAIIRHDNMLTKVKRIFGNEASSMEGEYISKTGEKKCYYVSEREADLLVMGYGQEVVAEVSLRLLHWKPAAAATTAHVPAIVAPTEQPATATMTSLELVDFINELRKRESGYILLRHDNFMQKIVEVFGGDAVHFKAIYKDALNRDKPMYRFPKREATLLAMSYSHKISAQVYDKMEELERQVKGTALQVPQTFYQALLLAAEQQKRIDDQQALITVQGTQLSIAAPKVEFHEKFVNNVCTYTATDIAKKLGVSARTLNTWLVTHDALFADRKHLKQWYMHKGFGVEKFVGMGDNVFQQCRHTAKGANWILENFSIHGVKNA